ncbi:RNA polymerase sigma factor SigJ [Actinoplanes sp. NPDC051851]|uniref:RNA polymerase sigma factor SigJ n=1 Tax=Actinoplanes sp. NPDC051851 TaxID=3154753 RepID=UPI0034277D71
MSAEFVRHRPMLRGLAYRLVGTVHDTDDVLQEAYLRWVAADRSAVAQPRRYLTRVVARLAVDQLRARQARRESYVGEWLPEPVATGASPFGAVDTSDLSIAVLHLMERLTPPQRAVFVLRTAFDLPYGEIAGIVDRAEDDCRQLFHRAERALHDGRTRFAAPADQHRRLLTGFVAAAREGDLTRLHRLLHADVIAWSDGGGRTRSARRPIRSAAKVGRFFAAVYGRAPVMEVAPLELNGAPALRITYPRSHHVLMLAVEADVICRLYVVSNPDKLGALRPSVDQFLQLRDDGGGVRHGGDLGGDLLGRGA